MEARSKTSAHVAAILNAWWMVRYYEPGRTPTQRRQLAQAILRLGLTVREAFNNSDDFKALLSAVADGATRQGEPPFLPE